MELLTPTDWTDYELIDTGNREKLERFGKYILIRPEPQAVWPKALPEQEWEKLCHARFSREKISGQHSAAPNPQSAIGRKKSPNHHTTTPPHYQSPVTSNVIASAAKQHQSRHCERSEATPVTSHDAQFTKERKEERGEWTRKPEMPDQWMIGYRYKEMQLKFRLGLTAFGHIGVFPEQAENWKYVYDAVRRIGALAEIEITNPKPETRNLKPRVLNLFAYTGGASLAAKAAGADVVHVDSVKQVINWAREDMENSGLDGIRWVVEDALKFVRREVKRGNNYDGIILDPPAYGRGPEGEKWILEDSIDEMIALCARLLSGQSAVGSSQSEFLIPHSSFLILSLYSMGFSSMIGETLVKAHFGNEKTIQGGEFYFPDKAGRKLPLGTFIRF